MLVAQLCASAFGEFGTPLRPNTSGQAFSGNVVYRALALESPSSPTFVAVGRAWNGTNYSALIKASLVEYYGFPDGDFKKSGGWNPGEQLFDFAGAGLDNLCNSITYANGGFVIACRSMMANGHYNIYLVKVDSSGNLISSFGTNGIVDTGLGTSSVHALVRGIAYNPDVNASHNGVVTITGATGDYAPGTFTPFLKSYDQQTGAAYSSTTNIGSVAGTSVGITYDLSSQSYYVAYTETTGPNHIYVAKVSHNGANFDFPSGWNSAIDFTQAISGGAAHSVPTAIAVFGSDVVVSGGNRVAIATAPWRCAVVALKTSDGSLDTSFGKVPLSGGTNFTGISLFSHETTPTRDCVAQQAMPNGTQLLITGAAYTAANSNYDYLAALLDSSGGLDGSFGTGAVAGTQVFGLGPINDVLNASALVNGGHHFIAVGRSSDASGFQGGDAQYFSSTTGAVTPLVTSLFASAPPVNKGDSVALAVTARFNDGSSAAIPTTSFNLSSNAVFTINSDGSLTAQSAEAGQATVAINGLSYQVSVRPYIPHTILAGAKGSGGTPNPIYGRGWDRISATRSALASPYQVTLDTSGNLYISDTGNHRIRMVPKRSGTYFGQSMTANFIYTIAGSTDGNSGITGNGGLATNALLNSPRGIAVDSAGNLYICDAVNNRIQMVPAASGTYFGQSMTANYMYTIAGDSGGNYGTNGNGTIATSALLYYPQGVAVDTSGNIYIADSYNSRIQMVAKATGTYFGQSMTAAFIYTVVGDGDGYAGDSGLGGPANAALLNAPNSVAVDSLGNLFVADSYNYRILMVPRASGTNFGQSMTANYVYLIAGDPLSSLTANDVPATSVLLVSVFGIAVDSLGNLYLADTTPARVHMVPKTSGTFFGQSMTASNIYLLAGAIISTPGATGNGGPATSALVKYPRGLALDSTGNLYIADSDNSRVQMVPSTSATYFGQSMTANYIYSIAGDYGADYGTGGNDGPATSGQFFEPRGIAVDSSKNIFIADTGNHRIQMIPETSGTYFGKSMTGGYVYTIAGSPTGSNGIAGNGGLASDVLLNSPQSITVDTDGNLYIPDALNNRVLMIPKTDGTFFGQSMTANHVYTIAGDSAGTPGTSGDEGPASASLLWVPFGVALDSSGNLYIADSVNSRIRMVPKTSGTYFGQSMTANFIYRIAGDSTGIVGTSGNGGPATDARLNFPTALALDTSGNLFIADTNNSRVQMVPKTSATFFGQSMTANYIYTVAGDSAGTTGTSGNGGPATAAKLNGAAGLALDAAGNLFISDSYNNRLQMVPRSSGTYFGQSMTANSIYTIGGDGEARNGSTSFDVSAQPSLLNRPFNIAIGALGFLYIANAGNYDIRLIKP